ncbi:ATP-dependent helicase [Flexivirga meconopsidis]|uniref:ATP-dependent helicase n=1 Tax=Flexivirga meconopsidis TaxID=2977121 RepID=UPI00224044D0|nr:ATP-dependent helicase [Flexivirga meconopsidis]
MSDNDWSAGLDEQQRVAVEHNSSPLVVAAGAGTGKTRTLTARVARLLDAGVPPERVLLLTFTRRAAAAMTTRAAAACVRPEAAGRIWGGTFHAVGHRLVAEHAPHLGLADVTVLDPGDVTDLLDLIREEHGLAGTGQRLPTSQSIADIYSRAVNTATPARQLMAEQFPWCLPHADAITGLLRDYGARKRARGLLDFDDLLLYWRALLDDSRVGPRLRARWDWVLVDEYQDVNQVQVDIVRGLRPDGDGLTVVGDDAQAVYGFRGASPEHLLALLDELPDASLVRLERNFRSTQPVLDLANAARPGRLRLRLTADRGAIGERPRVIRCRDADDEARQVADAVLAAHQDGLGLREQAVLMRTGTHSHQLEIELKVRSIPFVKYGGIGYLETAHVRDLLAAFRLALNPADEVSWYRLLTRHRAIGKAGARTLAGILSGTDEGRYDQALRAASDKARPGLSKTLQQLRTAQSADESAAVVEACHAAVLPLLRVHYADWSRRSADIERLVESAAGGSDLRAFIADATIDPANVASDWAKQPHLDEDYLTLSTIHSAKGLEWTTVHLIRASDGAIPSDMALTSDAGLAEEERLFYVAVTRARDDLRVYSPSRLPTHPTSFHARHVLARPSRFLTPEVLAAADRVDVTRPASPVDIDCAAGSSPTPVTVPSMDELFG